MLHISELFSSECAFTFRTWKIPDSAALSPWKHWLQFPWQQAPARTEDEGSWAAPDQASWLGEGLGWLTHEKACTVLGFEQQQSRCKTKQILAFRKLFYHIIYNITVLVHECFMTWMWGSEDNLWEQLPFIMRVLGLKLRSSGLASSLYSLSCILVAPNLALICVPV